ncbi:MAG: MerR family DNA-binding transcriptional regulator, partial [Candidatus Levybacteria bacterium]|nr:MerR family DNA-binding transcriptional regulator [Candidatus Levybacteria bacterium]
MLKSTRLDGKNRYFLKSELKAFKKTRPLSISEAASALSISVSTLRRLEKKGVIVAERSQNGERLYSPSRINEILASRKKGGRERVDLYAPIPTTLHGAHANFTQENTYKSQPTFLPQTPMHQPFMGTYEADSKSVKKDNFWKKNHLLSHIGQFNAVGEYMSFPKKGFKGLRFGNQASEYKRGILTITFLLILSMGIFAFTVLRDVNGEDAVLGSRTPEAQRALSKLSPTQRAEVARAAVLAATTTKGQFTVNIKSVFNEDIRVNNKNLDLGTGELTASNVIYSVIAGEGIEVSEGQNPIISNAGIISIGESTGEITLGSNLSISNNVLSASSQSVNSFANIVANGTTITAGSSNDTLTFEAGSNISLSASGKSITISATGGGSGTNYFTLSGNNLYPNSTSYSLGIGNSAPTATLDVTGTFKVSGTTDLNGVTYTWPGVDGSNSYILTTNGSGTLSWSDPGVLPSTNYWTIALGTLYPNNPTLDLLVGGTTSASAKFGFINVNSGTP